MLPKSIVVFNYASSVGARGEIVVDEYSRTSVPSIHAIGDVTNRVNLTPVALMEGMALAKTLFANQPTKPDYHAIPSAVFSNPEIATVVRCDRKSYIRRLLELNDIPDVNGTPCVPRYTPLNDISCEVCSLFTAVCIAGPDGASYDADAQHNTNNAPYAVCVAGPH